MTRPKKSVLLTVCVQVKEGQAERYLQELRDVLEKVRREPACLQISSHQDANNPNSFLLVETWRSAEEFAAFLAGSAYMREHAERCSELWAAPREARTWTPAG
jgi:quinol monooxygenase YgiN